MSSVVLVAVKKNAPDETGKAGNHPFYMIRCEKDRLFDVAEVLHAKYPNMETKGSFKAANAIHIWNSFKKTLSRNDYYGNHFTLEDEDAFEFFEDMFEIELFD